jgi:hypothetical protein
MLLAGAFVGRYLVQQLLGGFPFPDSIRGVEVTESGDATSFFPIAEDLELEIAAAVYGDVEAPRYVMFVIEIPEGQTIEDVWARVTELNPGAPRLPVATQGPRFACADSPFVTSAAACVWLEEGRLVEVAATDSTPSELRPLAREVRAETS